MPKDLNLCYKQKHKLSDIAFTLKNLTNTEQDVIIENNNPSYSYTGSGQRLNELGVELIGLQEGINECLKNWNKS